MTETKTKAPSGSYLAGYKLGQNVLSQLRRKAHSLLRTSEARRPLMSIEEHIAFGPKKTATLVNCVGRRFFFATIGDSITPVIEVQPLVGTSTSAQPAAPIRMEEV